VKELTGVPFVILCLFAGFAVILFLLYILEGSGGRETVGGERSSGRCVGGWFRWDH